MNLGISGCLGSAPRRVASSSRVGEVLCSSPVGYKSEASTISSPLRCIKGAMHLWSSLVESHKTPGGIPDLSVQVCSAQA